MIEARGRWQLMIGQRDGAGLLGNLAWWLAELLQELGGQAEDWSERCGCAGGQGSMWRADPKMDSHLMPCCGVCQCVVCGGWLIDQTELPSLP